MQNANKDTVPAIINTRIFPYKREDVFAAWSNPELIAQWWGPNGFTNTIHSFQFREGGQWTLTMHAPDGTDYPNEIRFAEINVPEKISMVHLEPIHQFTATAIFEDLGQQTKIHFSMVFDLLSEYEKLHAFIAIANEENFDRLETVLQQQKNN